ncbi:hypothetical protein D3C81_2072820 [compost metagenome]
MTGTGILLEQMNLFIAERSTAGVFVDMVVELLEFVAEARCCAFATTWISANNCTDYLASGF